MIEMFPLSCYNEDEYQYADQDEFDVHEDWDLFMINLGHGGTPRVLPYEIDEVAKKNKVKKNHLGNKDLKCIGQKKEI
jgi:hypothetical protein